MAGEELNLSYTSFIELDMVLPSLVTIHAKQYDTVRYVEAHLFTDGTKWYVPEDSGIYCVISYKKSDGICGYYDMTEDGRVAITVDGTDRSIVYMALDKHLLSTPGEVHVEIVFYDRDSEGRLSGFPYTIEVEESAVTEVDMAYNPYFEILTRQIKAVLEADQSIVGLQADATTLEEGSEASVTVTGGTGASDPYVLHFGLPRGEHGEKGNTGNRGNLLLNPWFTVNSRGFTQYIGAGTSKASDPTGGKYIDAYDYTVDRWCVGNSNYTSVQVYEDTDENVVGGGVRLYNTTATSSSVGMNYLMQWLGNRPDLLGKTVTLSVLMKTNANDAYTLFSATGTFNDEIGTAQSLCPITAFNDSGAAGINMTASGIITVYVRGPLGLNDSVINRYIRAVKLEIGSDSTLLYDGKPDYSEELEKCRHSMVNLLTTPEDVYANEPDENPIREVMVSPNVGVSELYEIGKTYLDHADRICYAVPSILAYDADTGTYPNVQIYRYNNIDKFPMVCGTLVQAMLAGIPYEQSRCVSGSSELISGTRYLVGGENVPYSGKMAFNLFSKGLKYYYGNFQSHYQLYAPELARLLNDAGLLHEITRDDLTELCVGDLLFFGSIGNSSELSPKRWGRVNHAELFCGWRYTVGVSLSTYTGATPGSTAPPNGVYYREFVASTARTNQTSRLLYYARIPSSGYADRTTDLLSKQMIGGSQTFLPSTWGNSYFPTSDTEKQSGKTYYTRSGTSPNYTYTEFTGDAFATGVTYYEKYTNPQRTLWLDNIGSLEDNRAYTIILEATVDNGGSLPDSQQIRFQFQPAVIINGTYTTTSTPTILYAYLPRFKCGKNLYYCCFVPTRDSEHANYSYGGIRIQAISGTGASSWNAKVHRVWLYDKLIAP